MSGRFGVSSLTSPTRPGALEGFAIGTAQAWVLRVFAPAVTRRAWIAATSAGAAVAWFVGIGGSVVISTVPNDWPAAAYVVLGVAAAAVAVVVGAWTFGTMNRLLARAEW